MTKQKEGADLLRETHGELLDVLQPKGERAMEIHHKAGPLQFQSPRIWMISAGMPQAQGPGSPSIPFGKSGQRTGPLGAPAVPGACSAAGRRS